MCVYHTDCLREEKGYAPNCIIPSVGASDAAYRSGSNRQLSPIASTIDGFVKGQSILYFLLFPKTSRLSST